MRTSSDGDMTAMMRELVADLRPVRVLPPAWLRATTWIGLLAVLAIGLSLLADLPAVRQRLMSVPDMWFSVLGSTLTTILASVAAFQLTLPDRSPRWALLPLPGLALWLVSSGLGCTRDWLMAGTHSASLHESGDCMMFIVGLSVPLSMTLFVMLRRGYSLHPSLTGASAGLAVAAAAATLLNLFHPYDAAITDLLVHLAAVGLIVLVNRFCGGLLLARSEPVGGRGSPRRR